MNTDLISARWYTPGAAGKSKCIYDSDEIMVDYRDGMLRISQFLDGHWRDEHFVELPEEFEPVIHAHWEQCVDEDEAWGDLSYFKCSACGTVELTGRRRCPECGAKMDETLELRTCYCPLCDKHFEVRSNDSMGDCPDCGHHVVLHEVEVGKDEKPR